MPSAFERLVLPDDFVDFVRAGQRLDYDASDCEPGEVQLRPLDALELIEIYVNSEDTVFDSVLPVGEDNDPTVRDPRSGEGYYAVHAVSLVDADPKHYWLENSVLLWYPNYREFGQWDAEHSNAIRFTNTTWRDIVANPVHFLNAAWIWDLSDPRVDLVTPWLDPDFDFRSFSEEPEADDAETPVSARVVAT